MFLNLKNNLYEKSFIQLKINDNIDRIKKINFENFQLNFFKEKFCNHLEENFKNYLNQLTELNKTLNKFKIKKAYWSYPPNTANINSLISSYLMKKKIEVIGFQHGGGYGWFKVDENIDKMHALSDYFFCDNFLSYGEINLNKNIDFFSKFKLCDFKNFIP